MARPVRTERVYSRVSRPSLGEGLITPTPPSMAAVDVEQEFRHHPAVGPCQAHGLPGAAVDVLPCAGMTAEPVQPPEFLLEQQPAAATWTAPVTSRRSWSARHRGGSCVHTAFNLPLPK